MCNREEVSIENLLFFEVPKNKSQILTRDIRHFLNFNLTFVFYLEFDICNL